VRKIRLLYWNSSFSSVRPKRAERVVLRAWIRDGQLATGCCAWPQLVSRLSAGSDQQLRLHPPCFSGTAARPLFGDDRAAGEDLAAPDPRGVRVVRLRRPGRPGASRRAGSILWRAAGRPAGPRTTAAGSRGGTAAGHPVPLPGSSVRPGSGHDLLPPRDRRGGVAAARPHQAGTRTAAATGDPVGVHDVRVARVKGQRLLPPAVRSAMALGPLDLFHARPPFL
jgi:hypothetical protein